MGFFNQAGKKKRKEKTDHTEKVQIAETEQASSENDELEKTMFLSPEDRHISEGKNDQRTSEEETLQRDSNEKTVQEDSNIINGSDYLLRINDTRMEVMLTLYRNFSIEELNGLLKENGIVFGIREKTLNELAQGKKNYEETVVATGTAAKDGRDGYFEYHFN
ncbi:MAG: FapA family protein, partial [Lachnospiraceae bacterium]|nr:FapA family protein [Lachnospiraceae bacterium]